MKDLQEDSTLEQVHFMQQLLPRKLDDTISMKLCEYITSYIINNEHTIGTNDNYTCIFY